MNTSATCTELMEGIGLTPNEHHTIVVKANLTVELRDLEGKPVVDQMVVISRGTTPGQDYKSNARGRVLVYSTDTDGEFEVRLAQRAREVGQESWVPDEDAGVRSFKADTGSTLVLELDASVLGPIESILFSHNAELLQLGVRGTLATGAKGPHVALLQMALQYLGSAMPNSMQKGVPDGQFGAETDAAVRAFQTAFPDVSGAIKGDRTKSFLERNPAPLAVDGLVGPLTLHALDALLLDLELNVENTVQPTTEELDQESEQLAALALTGNVSAPRFLLASAPAVPNRCGIVSSSPTFDADLELCYTTRLNALIAAGLNQNNLTRTKFYSNYFGLHPEIPWSMLASLVSRNAGFQLTDIERYRSKLVLLTALPGAPSSFNMATALDIVERFLESGNFLIFHDVFPQLLAYDVAKDVFRSTRDIRVLDLFTQLTRIAGVEPEVCRQWRRFFMHCTIQNFFAITPPSFTDPEIVRHTIALISNEQNYLEDRLMSPIAGTPDFMNGLLGQAGVTALRQVVFPAMALLGLTRLVFPGTTSGTIPTSIHHHVVGDFSDLDKRIETGRNLYFGAFMASAARTASILSWERSNAHDGSRTTYDTSNFVVARPLLPFSNRFSPRLDVSRFPLPSFPTAGPAPGLTPWGTGSPARLATHLAVIARPITTDAFTPPLGEIQSATPPRVPSEVFF